MLLSEADAIKVGTADASAVYLGEDLVWSGLRTIANLVEPWVSAHRGFGELYAPDNTPAALAEALAFDDLSGIVLDVDTNITSDGVTVVMHDTTVDRTTTGTGNVSSFTLAQFKALTLNPSTWADAFPGWADENPLSLDEWGTIATRTGGMPFLCECKDEDAVDVVLDLFDDIKEYVFVGVHELAQVATVKAAGFPCMYLPASSGELAATIAAAAPDNVAIGLTWYDDTWRQTLATAGVKIAVATSPRRTDFAAQMLKPGTVGMASSDPLYTLRKIDPVDEDDFATGKWNHGMVPSSNNQSFSNGDSVTSFYRGTLTGSPTRLYLQANSTSKAQWCMIGFMCRDEPFTAIEYDVTYDANSVAQTTCWPAISCWCPDDRDYYSGQTNGTNLGQGIVGILRQNGSMEMYRQDTNGVASTSIASTLATTTITAATTVRMRIERLVDEKIKLTRLDSGQSITSTLAQGVGGPGGWTRGGYFHLGKSVSSDGLQRRSFANVEITP